MKQNIIYYSDELNDEFSEAQITPKRIDENYKYEPGFWGHVGRGIIYYGLARPIAWVYMKLAYGHRVVNKKALRQYRHTGYFMYGNHTNPIADALIPTLINSPKGVYVIVHPNNVSMPVLGRVTPCLGALPLPDTLEAMRRFSRRIGQVVEKGACVTIYPEAHIWPYYTGIRPFKKDSFGYPISSKVPVFCFTNTYQKRPFFKKPRMVTYIEGPFFPDETLPTGAKKQELRDRVYEAMLKNTVHNDVELVKYVKKEEKEL